jgi:predicted nucleotidyltransferase component of viral defense system
MNQIYIETARLMTRVVPLVFFDETFALKGGTAINMFVRDMPRLSVDLDLVFPDHASQRALRRINSAIRESVKRLKKQGLQTHAVATGDTGETKLLVRRDRLELKIEVNFVLRSTIHPVRMVSLTPRARDTLRQTSKFPSCRWRTCTVASWLRRWTGSIRVIYST